MNAERAAEQWTNHNDIAATNKETQALTHCSSHDCSIGVISNTRSYWLKIVSSKDSKIWKRVAITLLDVMMSVLSTVHCRHCSYKFWHANKTTTPVIPLHMYTKHRLPSVTDISGQNYDRATANLCQWQLQSSRGPSSGTTGPQESDESTKKENSKVTLRHNSEYRDISNKHSYKFPQS